MSHSPTHKKLKPCPFCGPTVDKLNRLSPTIFKCESCGVKFEMDTTPTDQLDEVLGLTLADHSDYVWNTRLGEDALEQRVGRLKAALEPFAKSGEIFIRCPAGPYGMTIYRPAAGDQYSLNDKHLLAAYYVLKEANHDHV